MKLTITLPDSLKTLYDHDKFQDSLSNVLLDVSENSKYSGQYEFDLISELLVAFADAQILDQPLD